MVQGAIVGKLAAVVDDIDAGKQVADGLTAAEICVAYKAALSDFVGGRADRKAVSELVRLLGGALKARQQLLAEKDGLTAQKCSRNFYN